MFNLKSLIKFKKTSMKLKDLVTSIESINKLNAEKLPVSAGYKLSVFFKKVNPELTAWETARKELIEELGTKKLDEDGKETDKYEFAEDKVKEFNDKIEELLNQEVNIEIPEITIADLGDIKIEPKYLMALDWLIKD